MAFQVPPVLIFIFGQNSTDYRCKSVNYRCELTVDGLKNSTPFTERHCQAEERSHGRLMQTVKGVFMRWLCNCSPSPTYLYGSTLIKPNFNPY